MDSKVVKPLWIRITACGFGSVMVTSLAIGGLSFYRQYEAGEENVAHKLSNDIGAIQADIAGQRRTATGVALAIAGEPEIGEFLIQKSREEIVRRYSRNFASLKADADVHLVTFTDATGTTVARIHDPATFGDNVLTRRRTVAETVKTGRLTAGIEPGRMFLAMFATAPVIQGGKTVGVVDVGTALTNDYFLRLSKAQSANIAIHLLKGERFETQNSTFPTKPLLTEAELRTILGGGSLRRTVSSDGQSFLVGGAPISDYSGQKIGVMEVAADITSVANARAAALWSTSLATLAVAGLVLVGFLLFARSLAATIGRLTAAMGRLAAGDLQTEIAGQDRKDEIGAMARAVQVFKAAGIQHGQLTDEASDMRRSADEERTRTEAAREQSAGEQAFVVSAIGDGLVRLAEGDLSREITDSFPAEYRKLRDDFNAALRQLQGTMSSVIGSANGIQGGANEISQAAEDLSRRTEQQAASLEETAAALDEITATVRKTAEGANQARDAVSGARTEAERSGEVVQGAVGAMAAIERSSTEISQIIGVIDEIAFQTNLLALNAGVEAARAGEAGRGFAVVASEVRALAQRSAEAAKEIKTLIQASSAQVKSGVDLVGEAGRALARIVTQVQGVSGVVGEIAASAQEQATGLQQVNTAVNQMDQMTQQNAAMVEETTAASHSLAQEAEQLAKLIARFKVGAEATGTPKAAVRKSTAAMMKRTSRAAPRPASHGNLALKSAPPEAGWEEF